MGPDPGIHEELLDILQAGLDAVDEVLAFARAIKPPGDRDFLQTGRQWPTGGPVTAPLSPVNSIAGGKTADVISATIMPGQVGRYRVLLHLNPDLPTDPISQLTIAQDVYVSNIVTIPVVNPNPPASP